MKRNSTTITITITITLLVLGALMNPIALWSAPAGREKDKNSEQEPGPYAVADFGVALTGDARLKRYPGAAGTGEIEFQPGLRLDLGGGWRFSDWFRAGGEFGLISHRIEDARVSFAHFPLMGNVEFQLPNRSPLVPFFGGGPGVSFSMLAFNNDNLAGGDDIDGTTVDAVFAWQAYAGLRYRLNDVMSLGMIYRYFEAGESAWDIGGTATDVRLGRTRTHTIGMTFSMDF